MSVSVYVINLDRRPDRWDAVSKDLIRLGIACERVSAIDAKNIAVEEGHLERNNDYSIRRPISIGAKACTLSHIKAMKLFLQSNSQYALILEDDVELASDLPNLLKSTNWFPHPHMVVNLEVNKEADYLLGQKLGQTPSGREIREMYRFQYWGGAAAYLLTREGAAIAHIEANRLDLQIDHRLFDMSYSSTSRRLRPVQILPAMARQKRPNLGGFSSDIGEGDNLNKFWKLNQKTLPNRLSRLPFRLKLLWLRTCNRAQKIQVRYANDYQTSTKPM